MGSRRRASIGFLTRAAISLILLTWLVSRVDFNDIVARWKEVDWWLLLLAVPPIHLVAVGLRALRLRTMLAGLDLHRPVWWLVLTHLEGSFVASFLPGGIWGDVYRAYRIAGETEDGARSVLAVVIDKIVGGMSMLLISLASLSYAALFIRHPVFDQLSSKFPLVVATLVGLGALLWALAKGPLLPSWLASRLPGRLAPHFRQTSLSERKNWRWGRILLLSFLLQLSVVTWYFVIARSLGMRLPIWILLLTVPLVELLVMLPISVGGIGVREAAFSTLLAPFGVAMESAISFSLLAFFVATIIRFLSGVSLLWRFVWRRGGVARKPNGDAATPRGRGAHSPARDNAGGD